MSIGGDILEITWTHPKLGSGVFSCPKTTFRIKRLPRKLKKKLKKMGRYTLGRTPYWREPLKFIVGAPIEIITVKSGCTPGPTEISI